MILESIRNIFVKKQEKILQPTCIADWLLLIEMQKRKGELSPQMSALVESHDLTPNGYVVNYFSDGIEQRAGVRLAEFAKQPVENIGGAICEIVKWKTVLQCGHTHDVSKGYFIDAEKGMQWQWENVIYPLISDVNMEVTLDLACGHGRNTEFLRQHAKSIHLVDINQSCIDACRQRFGTEKDGVHFYYHVTDGNHLQMIESDSIDFVYSWDSMVHFDKLVVKDYVQEVARVLKPGGMAFLHHSNFGSVAPDSDWAHNVGTRSDMSAALMNDFVVDTGLIVHSQHIHGMKEGWGQDELDCVSILKKS